MIETFFVWLFGPNLSIIICVAATMGSLIFIAIAFAHFASYERWPWQEKK